MPSKIASSPPKYIKPPFTIQDVRKAIPPHCFERSLVKSLAYTAGDISMVAVLFYLATLIPSGNIGYLLWPIYWYCQGVIGTGIWILAHECGHHGFSNYPKIDNIVGWFLHSFLLVPYFSWQISHSKHHKSCGHMFKDQVYVPLMKSEKEVAKLEKNSDHDGEGAPIYYLYKVMQMLIVGWPSYLILNMTGQPKDFGNSHFIPSSTIFESKHKTKIVYSDIGIFLMMGILGYFSYQYGALEVFKYYGVPYLIVNGYLVMITFLQHTHKDIPHLKDAEWTFLEGALSTIDYDYGILNHFFHHIGDTHVAHHLFSTMPFYHAQEATRHLKEFLGPFYRKSDKNVYRALYDCYIDCNFVVDNGDVLYYHK